jgi:hypothetical protein
MSFDNPVRGEFVPILAQGHPLVGQWDQARGAFRLVTNAGVEFGADVQRRAFLISGTTTITLADVSGSSRANVVGLVLGGLTNSATPAILQGLDPDEGTDQIQMNVSAAGANFVLPPVTSPDLIYLRGAQGTPLRLVTTLPTSGVSGLLLWYRSED